MSDNFDVVYETTNFEINFPNKMRVLKFGGTSVGTVDSLRKVKDICENIDGDAVIVVSALGGITDKLIAVAHAAASGVDWQDVFDEIQSRHIQVIDGIVPEISKNHVTEEVRALLDELRAILTGLQLVGELSERSLSLIVSFGERMSSVIVANIIRGASRIDSLKFIKTERWFNKDIADTELSFELVKEAVSQRSTRMAVAPGFISTDRDTGVITNLGRGGSDYTAAIIAAALNAKQLEIWTDVDGFMTADPRIIKSARVIDRMTFIESMELCTFGAKIIYPPTIYPVFHKNIPILIKNTFNAEAEGTFISDEANAETTFPVTGISSVPDTCLISVEYDKEISKDLINTRIFNSLTKSGVSVLSVSTGDSDVCTSFVLRSNDVNNALKILEDEFAPELYNKKIKAIVPRKGVSTIAIVGENMKHISGIATRLFNTLERSGIVVLAYSQTSSGINLSFTVDSESLIDALKLSHETFF